MRAVILGGTGAIGGATAERLSLDGWTVDVTGRDAAAMPDELRSAGVRFPPLARDQVAGIGRLVGDDTDLLVDLVAYAARDARALLPVMGSVGQTVVISTRAVYVDADGRHINGDEPPRFPVPLPEDNPTLPPAGDDVDPHFEGLATQVALAMWSMGCRRLTRFGRTLGRSRNGLSWVPGLIGRDRHASVDDLTVSLALERRCEALPPLGAIERFRCIRAIVVRIAAQCVGDVAVALGR